MVSLTSSAAPVKIAIFGGRGGATMAAQTLLRLIRARRPYLFTGYLNDRLPADTPLYGGRVLCEFDAWSRLDTDLSFVAPLHKIGYAQKNLARILGLGIPETRWATLIDPMAAVADDANLGPGSILAAFATLGEGSAIGAHNVVRPGAAVAHGVATGDFVYIGPNVVLCGDCRIATGAHVAPGAVVGNDLTVGRFAVVGLGAVVIRDVPDYAVVAGNPARTLREVEVHDVS